MFSDWSIVYVVSIGLMMALTCLKQFVSMLMLAWMFVYELLSLGAYDEFSSLCYCRII